MIENLDFTTCQPQYFINIQNYDNIYFFLRNIEVNVSSGCSMAIGFMFTNMTHLTLDYVSIFNYQPNPFISIKNSSDMTLIGVNSNTTTDIYAQDDSNIILMDSQMCFDIENSINVFIYNNTIDYVASIMHSQSFAYLSQDTNITVYNNTINGHITNDLSIYNSTMGLIANNTVYTSDCYSINEVNNVTIFYNKALVTGQYSHYNTNGFGILSSTNDTFLFNTVSNATDGFVVNTANSTNYIENILINDSIGYYVNSSSFLILQDNHFQKIITENYSFDQYSVNNTINSIPYTVPLPTIVVPTITIPPVTCTTSASSTTSTSSASSTTSSSSSSSTSNSKKLSNDNSYSNSKTSPDWEIGIVLLTLFSLMIRKKRKMKN